MPMLCIIGSKRDPVNFCAVSSFVQKLVLYFICGRTGLEKSSTTEPANDWQGSINQRFIF